MIGVCIKYFHENYGGMLQAYATTKMLEARGIDYTFVEILIGAIVYVIVLVVLRDAFVCKYIDKTFHKILGQRRK